MIFEIFSISLLVNFLVPPEDLLILIKPSFSKNLILDIEADGYFICKALTASPIFTSLPL